ncbi:MAG TPA: 2'-deoxycytidine 5'-triphosphate deaminase [Bacteroidetes bacterium]|nr:2'-deoxycytidine 5'-triphosphate deaminase [Bacteroidota bacterium]HEX04209.1 2'-deoxycytidine 5'-triphosphate deaminase [Bacteroidota bacterium]
MSDFAPGVLSDRQIRQLVSSGVIQSSIPPEAGQYQPNSIDLRLGTVAYRVRCSFLPQGHSVQDRLASLEMYNFSLEWGAVLERGQTYLIPLQESLKLPKGIRAKANPKSSTGRLDVFTRTLTDNSHRFEEVQDGYTGPLFLEVFPRTFPVKVKAGQSLNQLRFFTGKTDMSDDALSEWIRKDPLLFDDFGKPESIDDHHVENGLFMGVDLVGTGDGIVGYRAQRHSEVIDMSKIGEYKRREFWEPIYYRGERPLILEPEEFYLFASEQRVSVPPGLSAEMVPYDTASGELRTHYAGFFDSGFGYAEPRGAKVVLEVRSHDVPFQVTHGQRFFRLNFQRNSEIPESLYGGGGSHYQSQGLALSKHFRS